MNCRPVLTLIVQTQDDILNHVPQGPPGPARSRGGPLFSLSPRDSHWKSNVAVWDGPREPVDSTLIRPRYGEQMCPRVLSLRYDDDQM